MKIATNNIDTFVQTPTADIRFVLLYGPDEGKISILSKKLLRSLQITDASDLNLTTFEYSVVKDTPGILYDEAASVSLLGGRKVIVVNNCGATLNKGLESALKNSKGDAFMIFIAGELSKTSSLRKVFENDKNCAAIACYKPDLNNIKQIIQQYLTANQIPYASEVPSLLAETLPANQLIIHNELDKLILYKDKDKHIVAQDILDVFTETSELLFDDLCFAVAANSKTEMRKQLLKLESNNINFIMAIRILINFFKKALLVKAKMQQGLTAMQAVSTLRPPAFFKHRDNLLFVAQKLSTGRVKTIIKSLVALEITCKRIPMSPTLMLEHCLVEMSGVRA